MQQTIVQKILARTAGRDTVEVGENLAFRPDTLMAYDFPGYTDLMFKQMVELGIDKVPEPEKYVLFIDHLLPNLVPKKGRDFASEDAYHDITREWAEKQGVALYEKVGIGHQASAELGYGLPGEFIVHFDAHITQLGAHGAYALGVRRDLLAAWVSGEIFLDVPATQRFTLTGELRPGVLSRDVIHHIIGEIDADGCVDQVMEFVGPGVASISIDGRAALCGMAMFTGAASAIFSPDEMTIAYARERSTRPFEPVYSDPDAEFTVEHEYDLSEIEPQVVQPPSPRNTRPMSEMDGTEVQQGYIGSCVSGRIEDFRAAAEILEGRTVKEGFRLYVIPSSTEIARRAEDEGLVDIIRRAGGEVQESSCDFCFGNAITLAPGEACVSTGTLNVPGRMGSTDANIYLASAYTVAASALEGTITDPRRYLKGRS